MKGRVWIGIVVLALFGFGGFTLRNLNRKVLPDTATINPRVFNAPMPVSTTSPPLVSPAVVRIKFGVLEKMRNFDLKKDSKGRIIYGRGEASLPSFNAISDEVSPQLMARSVLSELLKDQGLLKLEYSNSVSPSKVGDSVQYYFPQTHDGFSLFPEVGVSLIFQKSDVLIGIDADYVEDLVMESTPAPPNIPPGHRVIIYHEQKSGQSVGKYAYQIVKDGFETVLDPSTGKIIHKKSKRQY